VLSEYFSRRSLRNLIYDVGADQASPDACDELGQFLEQVGRRVARKAMYIATLSKRRRIKGCDIQIVINKMELPFSLEALFE
jgi:histone H3/H4